MKDIVKRKINMRVIVKEKLFLFFNNHEYFYIGNLENKYPIARLQDMVN